MNKREKIAEFTHPAREFRASWSFFTHDARKTIMRERAFSRTELLVIASVLLVLVALLIPSISKARAKAQRINCVGRLVNIGLGYRIWATDNQDLFPWEPATNSPPPKTFEDILLYYRTISNELSTPKILICAADTRKAAKNWTALARTNVSYFVALGSSETFPQSILAGDRNFTTNGVRIGPGIIKISGTITNGGWDGTIHKYQGNVAMGDGSVQQLSTARLAEQLKNPGTNTLTWAVP